MSDYFKFEQTSAPPGEANVEAASLDTFDAQDDALMLMSLSLDGLLESDDEARLQQLLAMDAGLRETWRQWQKVDLLFAEQPRVAPEAGFGERFTIKLEARERRARLRRQALFVSAAVLAWVSTAAMVVLLGWTLLSNQTQWMNDFVRELVFYPSAAAVWLRAVQNSLGALIGEPQSLAISVGYAAAAGLLLYGWLLVLRRTTREEVISS